MADKTKSTKGKQPAETLPTRAEVKAKLRAALLDTDFRKQFAKPGKK
ncbi:hypothetical protein [Lactiplantibacillus daowaiensis]|uniref:Uncharacterized protein n=1 Tax=Lactiplantibacillus daowaiensis TaxID=2559918 RepID=A0ABW1RWY8_9LACO|nr:hypothetical protein [Lactiplantibacillus daowaiensis]